MIRNEWGTSYDVTTTPDGPRFIMIKPDQEATAVKQVNVILNWSEELRAHAKITLPFLIS